MDAAHCLRPEFTARLAARLLNGESILLVSPHGRGRRRTVADLRATLPERIRTVHMNMRDYSTDYKSFFDEMLRHSGVSCKNIGKLFEMLFSRAQQTVIILHNFDEIRNREAVAAGYSPELFRALNSISSMQQTSLLCVCEQQHNNYLINADGTELAGTHLIATAVELPPL